MSSMYCMRSGSLFTLFPYGTNCSWSVIVLRAQARQPAQQGSQVTMSKRMHAAHSANKSGVRAPSSEVIARVPASHDIADSMQAHAAASRASARGGMASALVRGVRRAARRHCQLQPGDGRELVVHAAHEAVHLDLRQRSSSYW